MILNWHSFTIQICYPIPFSRCNETLLFRLLQRLHCSSFHMCTCKFITDTSSLFVLPNNIALLDFQCLPPYLSVPYFMIWIITSGNSIPVLLSIYLPTFQPTTFFTMQCNSFITILLHAHVRLNRPLCTFFIAFSDYF